MDMEIYGNAYLKQTAPNNLSHLMIFILTFCSPVIMGPLKKKGANPF